MGSGEQAVQGFAKTIKFIETAMAEGAHFKVPERASKERWERDIDITLVYLLSDESLEDTGRIYGGITRERVRQIRNKTISDLWRYCSTETQALFPFEELELEKHLTQKSRERLSLARGGRSVLVNRGLQAGKSIAEIKKENGLSIHQIGQSRYPLREWGTVVPYLITPHSKNLELENKLRNVETDQEKQELLNQVKRTFYHDHVKGENPLLTTIRGIALEAGLSLGFGNQNVSIVLESLKNVGFPMGETPIKSKSKTGEERVETYHFGLARDKERAKQILLSDPNLQRFRRS